MPTVSILANDSTFATDAFPDLAPKSNGYPGPYFQFTAVGQDALNECNYINATYPWHMNGTDPLGYCEGWYKWDLSSIPLSATISSATVTLATLVCYNAYGEAGIDLQRCIDTSWTEADLTYNNAPTVDLVGGLYSFTSFDNSAVVIDVTTMIQAALSSRVVAMRATMNGVSDPTAGYIFQDKAWNADYPSNTIHPQSPMLDVTYTAVGPRLLASTGVGA